MTADRRIGGSVVLVLLATLSANPAIRLSAQDYRAQAIRILRTVPLIDGHNDLPDATRERGGLDSVNIAVDQPRLHTDIRRLRAGGVGAQFWAAYVPVSTIHEGTHPGVYALEQIDLAQRLCARYPATFALARMSRADRRIKPEVRWRVEALSGRTGRPLWKHARDERGMNLPDRNAVPPGSRWYPALGSWIAGGFSPGVRVERGPAAGNLYVSTSETLATGPVGAATLYDRG